MSRLSPERQRDLVSQLPPEPPRPLQTVHYEHRHDGRRKHLPKLYQHLRHLPFSIKYDKWKCPQCKCYNCRHRNSYQYIFRIHVISLFFLHFLNRTVSILSETYLRLVFHTTSTADAMISDGKRKYCGPTTSRHTAAITIPAIAGIWLSAFSH